MIDEQIVVGEDKQKRNKMWNKIKNQEKMEKWSKSLHFRTTQKKKVMITHTHKQTTITYLKENKKKNGNEWKTTNWEQIVWQKHNHIAFVFGFLFFFHV